MIHERIPKGELHSVCNWEVADIAARDALTLVSYDKGKVCWVLDEDTFWVLKNHSPVTWIPFGSGGGGGSVTHTPTQFFATTVSQDYTLTVAPQSVDMIWAMLDGYVLQNIEDFTLTGSVFHLNSIPSVGQVLGVFYVPVSSAGTYQSPEFFDTTTDTTYTLSYSPDIDGTMVMLDGFVLQNTVDFTVAGNQITLALAPSAGQVLGIFNVRGY